MRRQSKLVVSLVFLVAIVFLYSGSAFAYLGAFREIDKLARDSDAVITGRVINIKSGGKIAPDSNPRRLPLIHKYAVVEVFRMYSSEAGTMLPSGSKVTIDYPAIDRKIMPHGFINGPSYPELAVGEIYTFPACGQPGDAHKYILTNGEFASGFMLTCVKKPIPNAKTDSVFDFIYSELAGTLAYGNYKDICYAARYISIVQFGNNILNQKLPETLQNLIETNVTDDRRWIDIAVAAYCAMGSPRPKITELEIQTKYHKSSSDLVTQALSHIQPQNRDELFVSAVIRHADAHPGSSGGALAQNDQYDSITNRLLTDRLIIDPPSPMAILLASCVIKDRGHPLIDLAVKASMRLVKQVRKVDSQDMQAVCRLITLYGDDNDFASLVKEMPKIVKSDDSSPRRFCPELILTKGKPRWYRNIPICRVLIGLQGNIMPTLRYCDQAVLDIQRITGKVFGFDFKQSMQDRDKVVAKVKIWLAQNPD